MGTEAPRVCSKPEVNINQPELPLFFKEEEQKEEVAPVQVIPSRIDPDRLRNDVCEDVEERAGNFRRERA